MQDCGKALCHSSSNESGHSVNDAGHKEKNDDDAAVKRVLRGCHAAEASCHVHGCSLPQSDHARLWTPAILCYVAGCLQAAAVGFFAGQKIAKRGRIDTQYFYDQECQNINSVKELMPKYHAGPSLLQVLITDVCAW